MVLIIALGGCKNSNDDLESSTDKGINNIYEGSENTSYSSALNTIADSNNSNSNSSYINTENNNRTQQSIDLIHRISISPKSILDIGCGPGNSTNQLYTYFPKANILGVDSSDNMLAKADKAYPYLKFRKCIIPDEIESIGKFDMTF